MNQTPRTDKFKSQGREWLPLGIFEKVERENTLLRDALKSALLRCNHGHDEKQDDCLCWQCEDDRKALDFTGNVLAHPRGQKEPEKQTECCPASDGAVCSVFFGDLFEGDRFTFEGNLYTRIDGTCARRHSPESIALYSRGYGYRDSLYTFFPHEKVNFYSPNVIAHPRGQKEPEKQTECCPASDAASCCDFS